MVALTKLLQRINHRLGQSDLRFQFNKIVVFVSDKKFPIPLAFMFRSLIIISSGNALVSKLFHNLDGFLINKF